MHTDLQLTERDQGHFIPRSPLLWLIIPLSLGYIYFSQYPVLPAVLASSALATAVIAYICSKSSQRATQSIGLILLFLSLFATGGFNLLLHKQSTPPLWDMLPPREVDLTLRLEKATIAQLQNPYTRGVGTIIDPPKHSPDLQSQSISYLLSNQDITRPLISGIYRVHGVLYPPGDPKTSYNPPNIHFNLRQGTFNEVIKPPNRYQRILDHITRICTKALAPYPTSKNESNILTAMVLGQRSQLSEENRIAFIHSGTMHLFAVSGLHVLAVSTTFYYLILLLPISPRLRAIITLAFSGLYVLIVGAAPSAIRAFLMIAFYLSADCFNRPKKPFPALTASALFVLLLDPYQLFSVGFQLSYLVVTSILLLGIPLAQWLGRKIRLFPFILPEDETWIHRSVRASIQFAIHSLSISGAASIGSAPIILLYFEIINPGAFILNAFLVPIASLIVINGILILLFSMIGLSFLSTFLSYGAFLLIRMMTFSVDSALKIPGFSLARIWSNPSLAYLASTGLCALLIILPVLLKSRPKYTLLRYLSPFLWIALTVALGSHSP